MEKFDSGIQTRNKGPTLICHEDVFVRLAADVRPSLNVSERVEIDKRRHRGGTSLPKLFPLSVLVLPQALPGPGIILLVSQIGGLHRSAQHERGRPQMARAIDFVINHYLDTTRGRGRDLLEAITDRVLESLCAVQVCGKQRHDPGRKPDDQEGGNKFFLKTASSPTDFHRRLLLEYRGRHNHGVWRHYRAAARSMARETTALSRGQRESSRLRALRRTIGIIGRSGIE